eukprot:NODE_115_length_19014_cov_0.489664.p5 type:complete len:267 gc:universal NODE_115_length_19014_cov_0.489664:7887-8687(+)
MFSGSRKFGKMQGSGAVRTGKYEYSGGFKNGKFHSYGTLVTNECIYEGLFENGEMIHGTLKTGSLEYTGNLSDYQMNNQGETYYYRASCKKTSIMHYRGAFFNGQYHGNGVCLDSNGIQYRGIFENNLKSGLFEVTFPCGQTLSIVYVMDIVDSVESHVENVFKVSDDIDSLLLQDVFQFYKGTLMNFYRKISDGNKWMTTSQLLFYLKRFQFEIDLGTLMNDRFVLPYHFVDVICKVSMIMYPRHYEKNAVEESLHFFIRYNVAQ